MSKHIELAKKLKELADKGIGGEKLNAENMLQKLLIKHNLTLDDIEGEKVHIFYFKVAESNVKIWSQIVSSVNYKLKKYGEFPKKKIKEYRLTGNYAIECTTSEYIEIEAKFDFYKKLYKDEVDVFFYAFCKANNLLISTPENPNTGELSESELMKYRRACRMANNITKAEFRKQLQ